MAAHGTTRCTFLASGIDKIIMNLHRIAAKSAKRVGVNNIILHILIVVPIIYRIEVMKKLTLLLSIKRQEAVGKLRSVLIQNTYLL